jgi:hypothetical protein
MLFTHLFHYFGNSRATAKVESAGRRAKGREKAQLSGVSIHDDDLRNFRAIETLDPFRRVPA